MGNRVVDAIVISPADAASQKSVMGSVQRVAVAHARTRRDAAVKYCLEYLGSEHPGFELEGSARSIVQFESILPEAAPCAVYAPIDLEGRINVVIDVPPEVYKLVRLVVRLVRCVYAE